MRISSLLCLSAVLLLGCTTATQADSAGDWPQWRGPEATSAAPDANPVTSFDPESGENIRWSTPMPGPASATPIVIGDYVFSPAGDTKNNRLFACGISRSTGEILWQHDVGQARVSNERSREYVYAECSPVVDQNNVYFMYGSGDLAAFTHKGDKLWNTNLVKQFGKISLNFGYASTPLLHDGKLYVQMLRRRPNSLLVCFDAATGDLLWKHERPSKARDESLEAYTSPLACTIDGKPQVIVYGGDALTGHDPATGKELWRYDDDLNPKNAGNFRIIGGPTQGPDGTIYFTSPRGDDLLALDVKNNTPKLKWFVQKVRADVPCPVFADGALFVLSGGKKTLYKIDPATGDKHATKRLEISTYLRATPTVAGGKLYMVDAEGEMLVLSADDELKELARIKLGGYPVRASIVAAGDDLLIRTADRLICAGE